MLYLFKCKTTKRTPTRNFKKYQRHIFLKFCKIVSCNLHIDDVMTESELSGKFEQKSL